MKRRLIALIAVLLSLRTSYGAEKVTWEQFEIWNGREVAGGKVVATTKDNRKHPARSIRLDPDTLTLHNDGKVEVLARASVLRIRLPREKKSYLRFIKRNAQRAAIDPEFLCGDDCSAFGDLVTLGILIPATGVLGAYMVATAPLFLTLQGISSLRPAKSFEIVP